MKTITPLYLDCSLNQSRSAESEESPTVTRRRMEPKNSALELHSRLSLFALFTITVTLLSNLTNLIAYPYNCLILPVILTNETLLTLALR